MTPRHGVLTRRLPALSDQRLRLPSGLQALTRQLFGASARGRNRQSPFVRRSITAVLVVTTLAGAFGIGYAITSSGHSDSSEEQARKHGSRGRTTSVTDPAATSPLTRLTDACRSLPMGSVPAYLAVASVANDIGPDPRTQASTRRVGVVTAQSITPSQGKPAYSITAVLLPTGASAPTSGVPVDRAGTVQLWIFWDGTALHKGIRTWNGQSWRMTDENDPASNALTISVGDNAASFYWAGLQAGERFGFVTADTGGCTANALGADLTPIATVRA
jgi:hypothetical protein